MSDLVLREDDGPVRRLILNRPDKRNALDAALVEAIGGALREAAEDEGVRVVVLGGAGKNFSTGMDLGALAAIIEEPEELDRFRAMCLDAWNVAESMPKPVVCVIHGACLGGAAELAFACDLRIIATDGAIGLPETRLGLVPDLGGPSRLPALVGLGRAKEMILTGRLIGGEEAERIGLVTRVAAPKKLDAVVEEVCGALLGGAPVALALAKRLLDEAARPELEASLDRELLAQEEAVRTTDALEGITALRERRPPRYQGF
jgi:enoyl-CoA hydratase/carnithine racemase